MQIPLLEVNCSPDKRIDTENYVIRGVKIVGRMSRNGRCYGANCLREAIPMYEGSKVNIDHRKRSPTDLGPLPDRPLIEQFGWLENVCECPDGLTGDLHYLSTSQLARQIVETAQRRPQMFGLSHDAIGEGRQDGEMTEVERITKVFSVDVVTDPATTQSIFESHEKEYRQMPEQATLLPPEAAPADPLVAADPVVDAVPTDPVEAIIVTFRAAAMAVLNDETLDEAAVVAAIKELIRARDKVIEVVSGEAPAAAPAADAAPAEEPTAESYRAIRAENAGLKTRETCRALLESTGRAAPDFRVTALAGIPDAKTRMQLIESFPKDAGSIERPRSMPLSATESNDAKPVTDGKSFAAAVTG